jgi:hypothetical protein
MILFHASGQLLDSSSQLQVCRASWPCFGALNKRALQIWLEFPSAIGRAASTTTR